MHSLDKLCEIPRTQCHPLLKLLRYYEQTYPQHREAMAYVIFWTVVYIPREIAGHFRALYLTISRAMQWLEASECEACECRTSSCEYALRICVLLTNRSGARANSTAWKEKPRPQGDHFSPRHNEASLNAKENRPKTNSVLRFSLPLLSGSEPASKESAWRRGRTLWLIGIANCTSSKRNRSKATVSKGTGGHRVM